MREALERLKGEAGNPYEGIGLRFVKPISGRSFYPTMDYGAQLLRPGEETRFKRETSNSFVIVMEGGGHSEVGDKRFNWTRNDTVEMPNFLWRRHVNTGKSEAVLYTVSDAALMRNIGQVPRPSQGCGGPHLSNCRVKTAGGFDLD